MNVAKINRSRLLEAGGLTLILAAALWLYRGGFRCLFIQDDFGWLVISRFHSLWEWAGCLFRFNPAGTYRPLSQETYFWFGQLLFGMWPPGFHIFGFAAHLAASLLLYALLRRFFAAVPSLTGTFCYAVHGAHVTSLFWISAFPEPLAMVFLLAAVLLFVDFDRHGKRRTYIFSLVAMLLGLMSKESILVLPLILAAYCALLARSRLLWTAPYFALAGSYMLLRITGSVQVAPYDLSFSGQTLHNLAAYLSWMAGFISNPFPDRWGWDMVHSYPWLAAALSVALLALFLLAQNRRVAGFALLWAAAALQPFLYFANHSYPYYLAPALAGLSLLLAGALPPPGHIRDWRRYLPALLVAASCLWLAQGTIRAQGEWWNRRTAERHEFVEKLLGIDREVPEGEIALIFGLRQEDFEKLEGGGVFKAYGLSGRRLRFMLPELDSEMAATLQRFATDGSIGRVHCYVFSAGRFEDQTEIFRKEPGKFLPRVTARFREIEGIRLEAGPPNIRRGADALRLHVENSPSRTIDLLYSIDGQLMPPALEWRLDSQYRIRIFADMTTPPGEYQFKAIRPSGGDNSTWIKVDARLTVR